MASLRSLCAPLLCTPGYYPDPGHEDKLKHSDAKNECFYGVIVGHRVGVVTSWKSLQKELKDIPGASYVVAATWLRLIELWNQNCGEYHFHEFQQPHSPMSTAPSSPSTLTESSVPSPSPSPSPPLPKARRGIPTKEAMDCRKQQKKLNVGIDAHYTSTFSRSATLQSAIVHDLAVKAGPGCIKDIFDLEFEAARVAISEDEKTRVLDQLKHDSAQVPTSVSPTTPRASPAKSPSKHAGSRSSDLSGGFAPPYRPGDGIGPTPTPPLPMGITPAPLIAAIFGKAPVWTAYGDEFVQPQYHMATHTEICQAAALAARPPLVIISDDEGSPPPPSPTKRYLGTTPTTVPVAPLDGSNLVKLALRSGSSIHFPEPPYPALHLSNAADAGISSGQGTFTFDELDPSLLDFTNIPTIDLAGMTSFDFDYLGGSPPLFGDAPPFFLTCRSAEALSSLEEAWQSTSAMTTFWNGMSVGRD
ncbi:hypothetical protein B0H10DRAFT_2444349 [Mycena sp. CBHHK59/15]|nr:hypothetical protein B0H10DRAFT_2444349 [Mycena sp. CBHHK59/15]